MENKELEKTGLDPEKNKYIVHIIRDTAMMKTYVNFSNRVQHPRVTMNMVLTGLILIALPTVTKGAIALPGVVICYVMGALLVLMGVFRSNISVWMMKNDPKVKENEELTYYFGNTKVRVENDGSVEVMGSYQSIYRIWEDETHFYVGMNEDDLLILPKGDFEKGDEETFKEFILEKSGADYRWKPVRFVNSMKEKKRQFEIRLRMKMSQTDQQDGQAK